MFFENGIEFESQNYGKNEENYLHRDLSEVLAKIFKKINPKINCNQQNFQKFQESCANFHLKRLIFQKIRTL